MIKILESIFIKNKYDGDPSGKRKAYGVLCGALGILLNVLLFAGKLVAGLMSASIAITADAFNNLSDAGSSLITMIGFRLSGQKPDHEHPFGHGRIEYISGLIVSMLIILMGFELGKSSIEKLITPEKTEFGIVSVIILSASIIVKLYMYFYNRSVGKKIDSPAMFATATDSLGDCIATTVVLACTLVSHFAGIELDAICGAAVASFILIAGIRSAIETASPLLGEPPSDEIVSSIEKIVTAHDGVRGIHDLVVHDYGPGRLMITVHAEVSASADILETHDMIDNIEKELCEKLGCEATIHMDPIDTDDAGTEALRGEVLSLIKTIDERITIHDFRIVRGSTHTNLIFDAVIPYDVTLSEAELCDKTAGLVKTLDEGFRVVMNIDRSYVK